MAQRLITLFLIKNSFALILISNFIIAASNKQVSSWEPKVHRKHKIHDFMLKYGDEKRKRLIKWIQNDDELKKLFTVHEVVFSFN